MEQTLIYTNTTQPMSRYHSNLPQLVQNQEITIDEPLNEPYGSSFPSQKENSSHDLVAFGPALIIGKGEEDDIEDEESEFKMGRLIRQASLNSSHMSSATPQVLQTTKVMRGGGGTNQEKVMNMRKLVGSMNRNKSSMKIIIKENEGAAAAGGGWVHDKASSEDMKAQIKFWARAVAFNLHQDC
ncbi:hypothetical protein R6Q59_022528 [Mikania micrantha]